MNGMLGQAETYINNEEIECERKLSDHFCIGLYLK